jgi:Uma2 family endonuclease
MVVEVVSTNREDDYVNKLDEYQRLGIPEYWIVDLQDSKVSVLLFKNERYYTTEFQGSERIVSPTFPELSLTAAQVLAA